MSKEKQIEEIRFFLSRIDGKNYININGYIPLAEALYEEGYRKQSDGVWTLALATYGKCICSNCKSEAPIKRADDSSLEYIRSKYCPGCGAKMKGAQPV